jgi:hypothetical protein
MDQEFDLSKVADAADPARRGRRRETYALAGFFVGLAGVGMYAVLRTPAGAAGLPVDGPIYLVLLGLSGAVYFAHRTGRWTPAPRRLSLSGGGLDLLDAGRNVLVHFEWSDPTGRLLLSDLRGLAQPGEAPRPFDYNLAVGRRTAVPLTGEAASAVERATQMHGWVGTRRTEPYGSRREAVYSAIRTTYVPGSAARSP